MNTKLLVIALILSITLISFGCTQQGPTDCGSNIACFKENLNNCKEATITFQQDYNINGYDRPMVDSYTDKGQTPKGVGYYLWVATKDTTAQILPFDSNSNSWCVVNFSNLKQVVTYYIHDQPDTPLETHTDVTIIKNAKAEFNTCANTRKYNQTIPCNSEAGIELVTEIQ